MEQIKPATKLLRVPIWERLVLPAWSAVPALAVFLPFAAGYFLSYWIRTINGPLSDGLVQAFGLGPRDLGFLTSLYFLSFAAFQIPAGLLIDRYGPRRVQAALFTVAAAGAFIFASADGKLGLMVGRTLIGLGCSAALVTGVKALALWLPPERRAMGNCCLVMCGGLGAMASTVPVGAVTDPDNWRTIFTAFGVAALAVSGLVWSVVPKPDRGNATAKTSFPDMNEIYGGFVRIVRDRRFWRVAPLSATVVGSAFAVHGLWAARWLEDVNGTKPDGVATVLLTMGACLTAGAVLFGLMATALRRAGVSTTRFFAWSCMAFLAIEAILALGVPIPAIISLGLFAVFGAITVLSFTMMGELFPTEMAGRANAALNVLHLGGAFVLQAGIGVVIASWTSLMGERSASTAYSVAFGLLIVLQTAALVWFATSERVRCVSHIKEISP